MLVSKVLLERIRYAVEDAALDGYLPLPFHPLVHRTTLQNLSYSRPFLLSQLTQYVMVCGVMEGSISNEESCFEKVHEYVQEAERVLHTDARAALKLVILAIEASEHPGDPFAQAFALRAYAGVLLALDDRLGAVESATKALALFESLGKVFDATKARMTRMSALARLSRFDVAMVDAGIVERNLADFGDRRLSCRYLVVLGNLHFRLDQFREELNLLASAEEIAKHLDDRKALSHIYLNRAVALTSLNDGPEALRYYELARQLAIDLDLPAHIRLGNYNICYLYFLQGEYTRALDGLHESRRDLSAAGERHNLALCDRDEGEIYLHLNLYDEAIEFAQKSYDAFEPLGLVYDMAKALVIIGVAEHRRQHYDEALQLFDRAKAIYAADRNRVWISRIECYQAMVELETGRIQKDALTRLRAATDIFLKAELLTNTIYSRLLIASFNLRLEHLDEAFAEAQRAIDAIDERCSPWIVHQLFFTLGKIQLAQSDTPGARDSFRRAIAELESLRENIHADYLRMVFLNDKLDIYQSHVRLTLDLADSESLRECFQTVERAKSRTLVDLLFRNDTPPVASAMEHSIAARIRVARGELAAIYRQIKERETELKGSAQELRKEARKKESRMIQLSRELPSNPSGFAAPGTALPASLDEIQASLPMGTALVEYYIVDGQIVAFAVTRHSFTVARHLADEESARQVFDLFRFQLSKYTVGQARTQPFDLRTTDVTIHHLQRLYQMLVQPLEAALVNVRSIVFVPHDFLHYLPFHALHDGKCYLMDRFEISVAPNATLYRASTEAAAPTTNQALLLGITDPRNPHMAREIALLKNMFPGAHVRMDAEATYDRLCKEALTASWIHIASHGNFRQDSPMFSSIELGDSQLSLFDVYNLKTSAQLVTLSGCGTGMNSIVAADELLGLVRGFLFAGARSLLVSLWDVDDQATAELMRQFYSSAARGRTFVDSLRSAMLAVRETHPHPFYWAPFVLLGDPAGSLPVGETADAGSGYREHQRDNPN